MKNITSVAVSLFFLLSFCSFSLGNVQKAENLGILASSTSEANAQKPKQDVKKSKTADESTDLNEGKKRRKQRENEQKEAQNVQPSSTKKQNEFKDRFSFLAVLNSKILKELGTPLAFPKNFSSEVWLRCNPVYGALLWRNKLIHNLMFTLKKTRKSGRLNSLIKEFFDEIGLHEVIVNKNCPKDNWGCVAGHLFLYEQEKIKSFGELSKQIQTKCKRNISLETLEDLFTHKDPKIKHFLPSLISAFVYAASKQFSDSVKAAEYLQRYRYEFKNSIKSAYNNVLSSYESLVDENLNDSSEEMKFFKESFNVLCESFIGYQVPTEQEFIKNLTYKYAKDKKVTWSNCVEAAFINWMIGTAYNPENHKFEPEKVTTNEILKESLSKTNGFDSLFDQSATGGVLQNLPFVLYRQIQIGEDTFTFHGEHNEAVVLVPHEFYEKLDFDVEYLHCPTNNSKDNRNKRQNPEYHCKDGSYDDALRGKYDGAIYFIDQSAYPDAFSFDLDSSPMNFLILCYHLGFPSLKEKFESAQQIFEIAIKPGDEIYGVLQDFVSQYGGKLTRKSSDVLLKFPFAVFDIPSRHSFFGFIRKNITLKSSELLEKDSFLKIILSEEDIFEDLFEKVIWALVKKKIPKNLQIDNDSMTMYYNDILDKIGFPDFENFIADLIIKDPTFLNEIQEKLRNAIIGAIGRYFYDEKSIIFPRLTKEITDRNILLKLMETLFDYYNGDWTEKFYHSSTKNQGILKAYGRSFFVWSRNQKMVEFVLDDLAINYQSFEREALVNMILEICSFVGEDNQHEMIQILNKLPFLTKEYLKGYSYSFTPPVDQPSDYKRIVSPSFYAAFALRYDLSFEFIREIEDESFDHKFDKYFEDLEIEQKKFKQLKIFFGNYEFFKGMESIIKVKKESDQDLKEKIDGSRSSFHRWLKSFI